MARISVFRTAMNDADESEVFPKTKPKTIVPESVAGRIHFVTRHRGDTSAGSSGV